MRDAQRITCACTICLDSLVSANWRLARGSETQLLYLTELTSTTQPRFAGLATLYSIDRTYKSLMAVVLTQIKGTVERGRDRDTRTLPTHLKHQKCPGGGSSRRRETVSTDHQSIYENIHLESVECMHCSTKRAMNLMSFEHVAISVMQILFCSEEPIASELRLHGVRMD